MTAEADISRLSRGALSEPPSSSRRRGRLGGLGGAPTRRSLLRAPSRNVSSAALTAEAALDEPLTSVADRRRMWSSRYRCDSDVLAAHLGPGSRQIGGPQMWDRLNTVIARLRGGQMPDWASSRTLALLAAVIGAATVVAPATASVGNGASAQSTMPPGDVYTCDWISNHQAAALAAGVTCDAVTFFTEMSGFPVDPQPATAGCCTQIPVPQDGGRVGPGVFAWGPGEYTNYWSFKANYPVSPYWDNWWIEKSSDNSVLLSGTLFNDNMDGPFQVPSTAVRKWGAQNKTQIAQNWTLWYGCTVC